ncbi:hypothetical protein KAH94_05900 [bacterium]|nr:hypothetical protein [bacterium]
MKKTVELIVHFDKRNYLSALVIMPTMILLMMIGLFVFLQANITFPGLFFLNILIPFFVKAFLYVCIGLFLLLLIYAPFFLKYKGPAAILDKNGIWIKHYNFIPWENIEEFTSYSVVEATEFIGIQVKDVGKLSKQSSWDGKLRIFWTKFSGNYHITLSNLDTQYEDIIIFAHRYLKG